MAMFLPLPVNWKVSSTYGCGSRLGTVEHALCQRMAYAIGIYVFDLLTDPVRAGMDRFPAKGVLVQHEAIIACPQTGHSRPGHAGSSSRGAD